MEAEALELFRAIQRGEELLDPEASERIRDFLRIKGELTAKQERGYSETIWRHREDPERLMRTFGRLIRWELEVDTVFQLPLGSPRLRRAVARLIGLTVTDMRRACSQIFELGEQIQRHPKYREDATRGAWQLTILTSWTLIHSEEVVFGSDDHETRKRFYDRETPPREPVARRRWRRAKQFFKVLDSPGLVVESATLGPGSTLRLGFSSGYSLVVVPTTSSDEYEYWKLWNTSHDVQYWIQAEKIEAIVTRMRDEASPEGA